MTESDTPGRQEGMPSSMVERTDGQTGGLAGWRTGRDATVKTGAGALGGPRA